MKKSSLETPALKTTKKSKQLFKRKKNNDLDSLEIEALVRSGQYFTTIATKLDKVSLELKKENESQKNYLQIMVDELLYVQSHYKIKKK
jgi:GTP-binding protein EngB required for normal cell division